MNESIKFDKNRPKPKAKKCAYSGPSENEQLQ